MFKMSSAKVAILAAAVAVAGLSIPVRAEENGKTGTGIGRIAPDFQVYSMEGKEVSLSDYKGQPVFVNFWSWWCPPCIKEAELLMNLSKKYEGRVAFVFVGINTIYRDKQPLDPQEFAEGFGPGLERFRAGLTKSRLVRPKDAEKDDVTRMAEIKARNQEVIDFYLTNDNSLFDFRGYWERQFRAKTNERYGIPVTYLLDQEGKIALDIHPNEQHWDKNDDILEDLIAGRDLSKYVARFPIPEKHQIKPETAAK
jgi:thiol-disulfide isomerase/thioredoxin